MFKIMFRVILRLTVETELGDAAVLRRGDLRLGVGGTGRGVPEDLNVRLAAIEGIVMARNLTRKRDLWI